MYSETRVNFMVQQSGVLMFFLSLINMNPTPGYNPQHPAI